MATQKWASKIRFTIFRATQFFEFVAVTRRRLTPTYTEYIPPTPESRGWAETPNCDGTCAQSKTSIISG
jgi:hypothetical protein